MMGISRSYVSRIETKAIGKLAKEIKEQILVYYINIKKSLKKIQNLSDFFYKLFDK